MAEFETVTYDTVGEDWDQIGEIEDIVLSSDGKLQGVVPKSAASTEWATSTSSCRWTA